LPKRVRNDPEDLQVMVTKANSIKGFWYVECDIISLFKAFFFAKKKEQKGQKRELAVIQKGGPR
jgi:hypothetical protein